LAAWLEGPPAACRLPTAAAAGWSLSSRWITTALSPGSEPADFVQVDDNGTIHAARAADFVQVDDNGAGWAAAVAALGDVQDGRGRPPSRHFPRDTPGETHDK